MKQIYSNKALTMLWQAAEAPGRCLPCNECTKALTSANVEMRALLVDTLSKSILRITLDTTSEKTVYGTLNANYNGSEARYIRAVK